MSKAIAKSAVIIFPSHDLDAGMLSLVSGLFGAPTVCLPWCMNVPSNSRKNVDKELFHVLRPPENLKPPENFMRMLKEYLRWVEANAGHFGSGWVAAMVNAQPQEIQRWEIQDFIRHGQKGCALEETKAQALRWHLILHLAGKMEAEKRQVENALCRFKNQGSPLRDAFGDESEEHGIFDDIPDFFAPPILEDRLIGEICEAWLGLFGTWIERHATLLTFDEKIKGYVKGVFEENLSVIDNLQCLPGASFAIPIPLSSLAGDWEMSPINKISRTVITCFDEIALSLKKKGCLNPDELDEMLNGIKVEPTQEHTPKSLQFEILAFPEVNQGQTPQECMILNGLSGKTLVFLKVVSENA